MSSNSNSRTSPRHRVYSHLANCLWDVQRQIKLVKNVFGEMPENVHLLTLNDSPNFFPAIRKIILLKYGTWQAAEENLRSLRDDLANITFQQLSHTMLSLSEPKLLEDPPVVALPDLAETSFGVRIPSIAPIISNVGFEISESIPITVDDKPVSSVDCQEPHPCRHPVGNTNQSFPATSGTSVSVSEDVELIDSPVDNVYDAFRILAGTSTFQKQKQIIIHDSPEEIVMHEHENTVQSGSTFDVLIYAPPHSGKTTRQRQPFVFGREFREFADTDLLFSGYKPKFVTFTNMPNLIQASRFSIALIPSQHTFENRCRLRGLDPGDDWYSGMVRCALHARVVIFSDRYLSEVL